MRTVPCGAFFRRPMPQPHPLPSPQGAGIRPGPEPPRRLIRCRPSARSGPSRSSISGPNGSSLRRPRVPQPLRSPNSAHCRASGGGRPSFPSADPTARWRTSCATCCAPCWRPGSTSISQASSNVWFDRRSPASWVKRGSAEPWSGPDDLLRSFTVSREEARSNCPVEDGSAMLDKTYQPAAVEARRYALWEASGAFAADPESDERPYTIMMPPPNVTGSLHMGHALTFTLQDVLVRYQRMRGRDVLWQPGTDHAGIATEIVVTNQ